MHELSIVTSLCGIINSEIEGRDVKRVKAVRLKVGRLVGIEAATFLSCFEMVTEGTVIGGAEVLIDAVPARWECRECNHTFEKSGSSYACPQCGGTDLKLVSGRELFIESLDVEM